MFPCPPRFPSLLFFLFTASLTSGGPLVAAEPEPLARSNEILLELQHHEALLEELESSFGPYDASLLEPLEAIARLLIEQGDHQAAVAIQGRRLGVMRTVLGLEHPDLIPMTRRIIETRKQLGDWEAVVDDLELIRVITVANYGVDSDQAFQALENQAQWRLAMVYLHLERRWQARNFMAARELYDDLADLAEKRWGEDSPELFPWYYQRAHNLAQLVGLLNTDDALAREVLEEVIRKDGFGRLEQGTNSRLFNPDAVFGLERRFPVVNRDELLGVGYLRQARGFINGIRDVAEQTGDMEAQGMAELYRGDFNVLDHRSSGSRDYRRARELLTQAGIAQARIDALFSRPMPIPVPVFYSRFEQLEAYQRERLTRVGAPEQGLTHLGLFQAWAEAAPAISKPVSSDPLFQIDLPLNEVELSFRLGSRGRPASIQVISAVPAESRIESEARRALRDTRFRPWFTNNRTRRLDDLQIRYVFARDE